MFYNKKKLKILESELSCYKSDYNHLREFITKLINKNQEQQQRIDKAINYIKKELIKNKNICSDVNDYNIYLDGMQKAYENCLEILGDKENEIPSPLFTPENCIMEEIKE